MKRLIPLALVILLIWSCEELAEEETPLCKECYKVIYDISTNVAIDTVYPYTMDLCGGDFVTFENFEDEVTDSTRTKHYCK